MTHLLVMAAVAAVVLVVGFAVKGRLDRRQRTEG